MLQSLTQRIPVRFGGEVRDALETGRAVVGLESSVLSHGVLAPSNYEVGRAVENAVRTAGAVPASIAVLDGEVVIGLDDTELCRLAGSSSTKKVSLRDIAVAVVEGCDGATTIAATMALANLAGISTVASAGLGGVHRGFCHTHDVSPDLHALSSLRQVVVCAGAKPILDIPNTLEFLEANNIPVVGFGGIAFPAFYCRTSGSRCSVAFADACAIAEFVELHWQVPASTGVVVATPIPEEHALDLEEVEAAISSALVVAATRGVSGGQLTPFLLAAVNEMTDGRAALANAEVLKSTALVAGELAIALESTRASR